MFKVVERRLTLVHNDARTLYGSLLTVCCMFVYIDNMYVSQRFRIKFKL